MITHLNVSIEFDEIDTTAFPSAAQYNFNADCPGTGQSLRVHLQQSVMQLGPFSQLLSCPTQQTSYN